MEGLYRFNRDVADAIEAAAKSAGLPDTIDVMALAAATGLTYVNGTYGPCAAAVFGGRTYIPTAQNVAWAAEVRDGMVVAVPHPRVYGRIDEAADALRAAFHLTPVALGLPPVTQLPVPSWVSGVADDLAGFHIFSLWAWAADAAQMVADFTAEMERAIQ